jgi:magnesium transporter
MSTELTAQTLLNDRFLIDYPREAARVLETFSADANLGLLKSLSPTAVLRGWQAMAPDRAAEVLDSLPAETSRQLLLESDPEVSIAALARLSASRSTALLATLPDQLAQELRELMQYPKGSVGFSMDPRVGVLDVGLTVAQAAERLRSMRLHGLRDLFVVDDQLQLLGLIEMEDLVLSAHERPIREFMRAVAVAVRDTDPIDKAADILQQHSLDVLAVVNEHGRFRGVIRLSKLAAARRSRWWWPA